MIDLQIESERKGERMKMQQEKKKKIFVQEGNMLTSIKKYADSARTAKK